MGKVTEKPLRVALVHDFLFTYGGAERVLSIFHGLFPDAPIYTLFAYPEITEKHFPGATIITSPLQNSPLKRWPPLLLAAMPQALESFDFSEFDVVLSSSGAFSHGIITGPDTKHVCYCHSPMRYAWDWHHEYLAERGFKHPLSLFLARRTLSKLRLWDMVSSSRVDTYLANSGVVASRIQKFYRLPAKVIYPPIDTEYFDYEKATPVEMKGTYAVSASRLSPNKRIDIAIRGCAKAGMPLTIIGGGAQEAELKELARTLGADIRFTGRISEDEKRDLIAGAACFVFAAEDDFGIGPAEALSLGVPLITLKKGGIQEILLPGKNGLFFTEPTPESLAKAVSLFKSEGVSFSKAQIRESVAQLSTNRFKKEIVDAVSHA